jgi:hypothetical protein
MAVTGCHQLPIHRHGSFVKLPVLFNRKWRVEPTAPTLCEVRLVCSAISKTHKLTLLKMVIVLCVLDSNIAPGANNQKVHSQEKI